MTKYHKILTTTIGSYPKPDYVPTPDWFRAESTLSEEVVGNYNDYLKVGALHFATFQLQLSVN